MAHLYDKAPPKFATDPWAWDYTRDKMESSCGRPYDEWEGRHFAGAAQIYKNVVKKYGESRAEGRMTLPKECADCGNVAQHYEDDYICVRCREMLEGGAVPEGAVVEGGDVETMGLADTREELDKLIQKSVKNTPQKDGGWSGRNYGAMGYSKLHKCIKELEGGYGDAYERCVRKGGDPVVDLAKAREAL